MSEALAQRVDASVRGQSRVRKPGRRVRRRFAVAAARLAVAVFVLAAARSFIGARSQRATEMERARSSLRDLAGAHAASLSAPQKDVFARAAGWLAADAGPYGGDLVDAEVARTGMPLLVQRSVTYVRGEIGAFRSAPALAEETASNRKDALLACLYDPPASRDEKAVVARVRDVYLRGVPDAPKVDLLHAAAEGLPFLSPQWQAKIGAAGDVREIGILRRAFERAPIEAAKRVARAELLLYAMDEPRRGSGPTEVDGEGPHDIRVGLIDMSDGRVLMRFRKPVDPASISSNARVVYARGMDGCTLAMSVREGVEAAARTVRR
jgi:hypothetical protein